MNSQRLKQIGYGLIFVLIQLLMFRHLKLFQIQADLILIYIIWVMVTDNRTSSIVIAALLGFVYDMLMDTWGLHMFTKTFVAFAAFNIMPRYSEIRLPAGQVFFIVFGMGLLHNILFLGVASFIEAFSESLFFWRHWIGNSIYTALVGMLLYLFKAK